MCVHVYARNETFLILFLCSHVLCSFSCLHFLSSVVVEISSSPSFSHSASCAIFYYTLVNIKTQTAHDLHLKRKKKRKMREAEFIYLLVDVEP